MYRSLLSVFAFFVLGAAASPTASHLRDYHEQQPLQHPSPETSTKKTRRIAIIGAGLTGASVAYTLHNSYGHILPLDITVFEASGQPGGLINSTLLGDDSKNIYKGFVENGASTFRHDDYCVLRAISSVGLLSEVVEVPEPWKTTTAGVWDGERIVLQRKRDLKARGMLERLRDTWEFGFQVTKMWKLVDDSLAHFSHFYGPEDVWPERNLATALRKLGLEKEAQMNARRYFEEKGIPDRYVEEVIEPTVRRAFGHGLDSINALSALVAMDPKPSYAVKKPIRGTVELVRRLLQLSEATIRLNTHVASITRVSRPRPGKFILRLSSDTQDATNNTELPFDIVILATPLARANLTIDITPLPPKTLPNDLSSFRPPPFIPRHTTHFTTPYNLTLSPALFNLTTASKIPNIIYPLPTLSSHPELEKLGIYSIERDWRAGYDGGKPYSENLYTLSSASPISDSTILHLLGAPSAPTLSQYANILGYTPEPWVTERCIERGCNVSPSDKASYATRLLEKWGVRGQWVHRKTWPLASPKNVTGPHLNDLELVLGLFYTGVAEDVVPSMEMGCRVGDRVGKMVYDWLRYLNS